MSTKWAESYRFFAKRINLKWFLGLLLADIIANIGLIYFTETYVVNKEPRPAILDLAFGFTPQQYYEWIDLYGETGRTVYFWTILILDTAYPIAYTSLMIWILVALLEYSYPKLVPSLYKWVFFPVLITLADAVENITNLVSVSIFPEKIEWLAKLSSGVNQLKWVLLIFVLTGAIIGLLAYFSNRENAKKELNTYE